MTTTSLQKEKTTSSSGELHRSIGFWGLMFVSLGSIIGSGWLLGALYAAQAAGPASLISWVLAGAMLAVLALVHAELGAAYPVAGGTARFPYFAFGTLAGFTAGWIAWLQAVTIAPIEVEASITYLSNTNWARKHLVMVHHDATLNLTGIGVASLLMLLFTVINLMGAKLMSESNSVMVIWKTIVPLLTVVVLLVLVFHTSNFHAGGKFAPYGAHGIFAALPAGVVFALQGFEQAIQMGGEARNPQKDVSRAVITAMCIGTGIYILLQVAFLGGVSPTAVRAFFQAHYMPDNAVLALTGDFDTAIAETLITRRFGRIPARPLPPRPETAEPPFLTAGHVALTDNYASLPCYEIAYRIPPVTHPDDAALTLLSDILGKGRSCRLERPSLSRSVPLLPVRVCATDAAQACS